jgi:hypothetical protein
MNVSIHRVYGFTLRSPRTAQRLKPQNKKYNPKSSRANKMCGDLRVKFFDVRKHSAKMGPLANKTFSFFQILEFEFKSNLKKKK